MRYKMGHMGPGINFKRFKIEEIKLQIIGRFKDKSKKEAKL